MAVRKIITLPNPHLREKSKPVVLPEVAGQWDKKITEIITDLLDTVQATKDPEGVGLSAVQIDKLVRIFVVKIATPLGSQERGGKNNFEVFINPEITNFSKKMLSCSTDKKLKQIMEGCLSIPDLYGFVNRPIKIKISWIDIKGVKKSATFEGK